MSRKSSAPPDVVERALDTLKTTQSASELRRSLTLALPAIHGLSLKDTASLLGRSVAWVAKERHAFIHESKGPTTVVSRGGRRNQLIPPEEEDAFMEEVCRKYILVHAGWRLGLYNSPNHRKTVSKQYVEFTQDALEERIQRKTTRTTVYNLLARTGKKRFANYRPYMWAFACTKELPSKIYLDDKIADTLRKHFNLSRKKPRAASTNQVQASS